MIKIWIEGAECLVPRRGTNEERRRRRDELRRTDPVQSTLLESIAGYDDPDNALAGDDYAVFNWDWFGENEILMSWMTKVPVSELSLIQQHAAVGKVRRHTMSGDWVDFSFTVTASHAFDVLRNHGIIPADSVLMNESEAPLNCDEEDVEAPWA